MRSQGRSLLVGVVIVCLALLVGQGCAFRTVQPGEECGYTERDDVAAKVVEDAATRAELDSLKAVLEELERRVVANKDAAAEAMTVAEKALKCCRGEYTAVMSEMIYFGFNQFTLNDESQTVLDQVAARLKSDPDYIVEFAGHTDAVGNIDYNILLGQKRSAAARDYLINKHHIDLNRMAIRSSGKEDPIAENETDKGRAQNRRVSITVMGYAE